MEIKKAEFLISSSKISGCPKADKAEYAFIGRSNVGKSSLINVLCREKNLAKTSSTPGKTQLINHFNVDDRWYLVDLPGYGYAKVSKTKRDKFQKLIESYLVSRQSLMTTFVLVDSRHEPQKSDLEFINWMGMSQIPFIIVFTKADKLKPNQLNKNVQTYKKVLSQEWEEIPEMIITSSSDKTGRTEILNYIGELNELYQKEMKK
ncbi:MAG: ribosome biogenesis GTP-binding protein YihA/YsxC [Hyphomicrobiales bacterium]